MLLRVALFLLALASPVLAQSYTAYYGSGSSVTDPVRWSKPGDTSFVDTTGFTEVSCAPVGGQTTAVIITFGQSTASNVVLGTPTYTTTQTNNHQYSLYHDKCFRTMGIGLNASGTTQWWQARLGDNLITNGTYQRVVLAPLGNSLNTRTLVNATTPPYDYNKLAVLMRKLIALGLTPTHILFTIGDGDCTLSMTGAEYTSNINAVLRSLRAFTGNWKYIFPIQSFNPSCGGAYPTIANIQAAAPATFGANVVVGPNADSYTGSTYRDPTDLVHWNQNGAATIAAAHAATIAANP